MTQDYLPFPEIVEQLSRLSREQVTGTLFLATKANRSAQIMLEKGEIVFVYFYNKRGSEAIELMTSIVAGRLRFQAGQVPGKKQLLPPTSAILAALKEAGGKVTTGGDDVAATASQGGVVALTDQQKETLEACLAEFIGPMAAILCEEHFAGGKTLEQVVEGLASEIPSADQASKFTDMVQSRLG